MTETLPQSTGVVRGIAGPLRLFLVPVLVLLPALATIAWVRARNEARTEYPELTREFVRSSLEELKAAQTDQDRYYALGNAAMANVEIGKFEVARRLAEELDVLRRADDGSWNRGNAIQEVNVVLGRLALHAGDVEQAKQRLLAAGRSPGSPQMDTFGPNMSLARDLIKHGEREVVLEYFELCRKFWKSERGRLDEWADAVRRGKMPKFGANLYF